MAGSLKYFVYTTDLGDNYAIFMDESNGEAIGNPDYLNNASLPYTVPRNVEPRYAVYANSDGTRNIRIPVSTLTLFNGLQANLPTIDDPLNTAQDLSLVRLRPEVRRVPQGLDTGLTDGDPT